MNRKDDAPVLAYFRDNPTATPTMRELIRAGCGVSTSTLTHQCERLAAAGHLDDFGARHARRFRLAQDAPAPLGDTLAAAIAARDLDNISRRVRLLLERTERRGGYGVVPWAAIEALREAVQG